MYVQKSKSVVFLIITLAKHLQNYEYYHMPKFNGRPEEALKTINGTLDNFLRGAFAKVTGISRGKKNMRMQTKN